MRATARLGRRLAPVAREAERLVVARIPEERGVALVRGDVIDDAGCCGASTALALGAERMRTEEGARVAPPSVVVAAFGWRASVLVLASALLALVHSTTAAVSKLRAARVRTGTLRAERQSRRVSPGHEKSPAPRAPLSEEGRQSAGIEERVSVRGAADSVVGATPAYVRSVLLSCGMRQ